MKAWFVGRLRCEQIVNASRQYYPEPMGTSPFGLFHRRYGIVFRMNDLGKRIDDVKGSLDRRIDDLKNSMDARFYDMMDFVKSEFKRVDERIDRLESPLARK